MFDNHYEREYIGNILQEIDSEIDNSFFFNCNVIDNSLKMTLKLQKELNTLRDNVISRQFETKEEEIIFFKEYKPEILSRLLYFIKYFRLNQNFLTEVIILSLST